MKSQDAVDILKFFKEVGALNKSSIIESMIEAGIPFFPDDSISYNEMTEEKRY